MFRRRTGASPILAVLALILGLAELLHVSLGGLPLIPLAIILLALALLL